MPIRYTPLPGPPRNPLVRLLVAAAGIVFFIGAAFLGALVFLAVMGVLAFGALLVSLRVWWLRRRMRGRHHDTGTPTPVAPRGHVAPSPAAARGAVIDGDYTVVAPEPRDRR